MTREEFLAMPKPKAIKYAWEMLRKGKINKEQYGRLVKSISVVEQNKLIKDAEEVFGEEEV